MIFKQFFNKQSIMNKEDLRIVFMGTPEFAVESLRALLENGFNVVGVITVPDKPAGRGQKIQASPVKIFAEQAGLKILQPVNLKDAVFQQELKDLNATLQIIVAFRMLPEAVWNMPPMGSLNLHGSLLPQYRGAAPINHAVINGEKESGVTTFFLKHEIDTGDIIFAEKVNIDENETAGELHDKLMLIGAQLIVKTANAIVADNCLSVPQDSIPVEELKPAPKIFKETCKINWSWSGQKIHNHVRGLSPYPTAWAELVQEGKESISVKIFRTEITGLPSGDHPGTMETDGKTYLHVNTGHGKIAILEWQMAGKKRLHMEEFLRGFTHLTEYYLG